MSNPRHSMALNSYLKICGNCQLQGERESFEQIQNSVSRISVLNLNERGQERKDQVGLGDRVNDSKPLDGLRMDPVPVKSFVIVSLHKTFVCKPARDLVFFCARLLKGQCVTVTLQMQNKELRILFSFLK